MCDLRRTEPAQGSVRQIVLAGIPPSPPLFPIVLVIVIVLVFPLLGDVARCRAKYRRTQAEAYANAMLHWLSGLSCYLPKPKVP
jgi:hypothetical protein